MNLILNTNSASAVLEVVLGEFVYVWKLPRKQGAMLIVEPEGSRIYVGSMEREILPMYNEYLKTCCKAWDIL